MDKITDKLSLGTLGFFVTLKFLEFLRRAGVARNVDGWRKGTQCYLRTEQSKFVLAAFSLDMNSDLQDEYEKTWTSAKRHCLQRLASFLRSQPVCRQQLWWGLFDVKSRPEKFLDVVETRFETNGHLLRLIPCLDPGTGGEDFGTMPADIKDLLIQGIIQNYNQTQDHSDKKRPLILKKQWKRWLSGRSGSIPGKWRSPAADYGDRILSAAFIQFEVLPSDLSRAKGARFQVPPFIRFKHPGFGMLNMVCRFTADLREADLWVQFSHVLLDGVPAQEILNDLKKQWGTRGVPLYPASGYQEGMVPEPCSSVRGEGEIFQAHQFLDFQPFLKVRSELNKRFGRRAGQVVSSAALLIWKLAQYQEFEDVKFAVPIDLRATSELERTLGFIFIRPNTYFDRHRSDRGFFEFQREFNRQLFATRKRRSESYRLLKTYAVASPILYAAVSKFLSKPFKEYSGSLGISIIKKADFFVAPASDVHTDGFIAFSNFTLPSENGGKVGVVSMKGPREKIQRYARVLHDIMHKAIQYDELYF